MVNTLEIWTIYERPVDYPNGYVVRRTVIGGDRTCAKCLADVPHGTLDEPCPLMDRLAYHAKDLAGARSIIPLGLGRIARSKMDNPSVLESWL